MSSVIDYTSDLLLAQANRWRKRGISVVPLRFGIIWFFNGTVLVDVYATDGSVAVVHSGIEMGQGINTKVSLSHTRTHTFLCFYYSVSGSTSCC